MQLLGIKRLHFHAPHLVLLYSYSCCMGSNMLVWAHKPAPVNDSRERNGLLFYGVEPGRDPDPVFKL